MTSTLAKAHEVVSHVWTEPRAVAEVEAPAGFFALKGVEPIDFDWYEPRHDQPWRRQVARDREAFGGEYVAGPRAPVEGPNNPNRLRRELEQAEADLGEAVDREEAAIEEVRDATFRAEALRTRLERLGRA